LANAFMARVPAKARVATRRRSEVFMKCKVF